MNRPAWVEDPRDAAIQAIPVLKPNTPKVCGHSTSVPCEEDRCEGVESRLCRHAYRERRGHDLLLSDVLNLGVVRNDPDWAILQLPTGPFDFVEVYGASFDDERLMPSGVQLMMAFVVDDLVCAHEESRAAGVEVNEIVWAREAFGNPDLAGYGWFFLRAPDGNTYVIQQVPT